MLNILCCKCMKELKFIGGVFNHVLFDSSSWSKREFDRIVGNNKLSYQTFVISNRFWQKESNYKSVSVICCANGAGAAAVPVPAAGRR